MNIREFYLKCTILSYSDYIICKMDYFKSSDMIFNTPLFIKIKGIALNIKLNLKSSL